MATYQSYSDNEDNTDDLEKALVLAAADADARNNEDTEVQNEEDSSANVVEEKSTEEEQTVQSCPAPVEESTESSSSSKKRTSLKRKLSEDSEPEKQSKVVIVEKPNEGYGKIIATHYNTLEEKGLDERSKSRIFYMRNFHNWIKSMLINEYLTKIKDSKKHNAPTHVLDIGCGKGGDLLKWRKGGISHLICSDIAQVSLEQCKSRYCDMQSRNSRDRGSKIYSIEYIPADSTKDRLREKYKDPSLKLDLVSCQFVFHYCFESLTQAECMLHNAAECLQPGGYFIGTIPDSNDLISRVRKSETNSFGNEVFKVTFDCDINDPPLFGAKYNFQLDGVVNCPEFLVHFPMLIKLAKKFGLKLVAKEKFYDFYERMNKEGRHLMNSMRCLEAYPPHPDCSLVGTASDDYAHADKYLKTLSTDSGQPPKIGTLSKSEWEVSSLYMTFAFQKVADLRHNMSGIFRKLEPLSWPLSKFIL